jgi:hypothetical protein
MLPEDTARRAPEARALLVALAAAVDLRSGTASDFAVRVICRTARASLVAAARALRSGGVGGARGAATAQAILEVRCALRVLRGFEHACGTVCTQCVTLVL